MEQPANPAPPPVAPVRHGRPGWLHHQFTRLYARVFGWKMVGEIPEDPRLLGIIAPHTSNWDVFMLFIMAGCFRIKANWLAKDSLIRPPLGWLFRPLGAIPVDRSTHHNLVDQVVATLNRYPYFYLAIAPEGTRRKTDHWKTGFYWIAHKAGIRIILMFIDYAKKEIGFGPVFTPSGDIHKDFEFIRAFYGNVTPRHPALRSDMVIRTE